VASKIDQSSRRSKKDRTLPRQAGNQDQVVAMASFQSVKEARNLLFDEDDYVCNIHDLDHGPMALSTIEKFDKREEGALQVADALPDSLPILSLATPDEAINLRDLHNDRPLVITFGSFS